VFSGITGKSFNRELEVRVADDVANDVADEFAGDVANEVAGDVANEVAGDVADDSTDEAADAIIFEVVKVIICFETKVSVGVFEKDVAEADDDADWEHVDKAPVKRKPMVYKHLHYSLF
jgi:hypothetical protein